MDEKPEGWVPPGPLPTINRPDEDVPEPLPAPVDTTEQKSESENPEDFDKVDIRPQPTFGKVDDKKSAMSFTRVKNTGAAKVTPATEKEVIKPIEQKGPLNTRPIDQPSAPVKVSTQPDTPVRDATEAKAAPEPVMHEARPIDPPAP
jgi:hypothetical protein